MNQRLSLERQGSTTRVLLADKNLLFRRGLRTVLEREPELEMLDDAVDSEDLLSKVQARNPQILVVSLELLGGNPSQFGFFVRKANPNLSMLVLTPSDSPENLQHSIDAGAKGYMLKDSSPSQFLKGIRQLASNDGHESSDVSSTVPDLRALAARTPAPMRPNMLTSREQEVVRLLAEGRTVKEVARDLSLSIKTVEAHKLNLMRKLNIHNRSSLIEYAMREGMVNV